MEGNEWIAGVFALAGAAVAGVTQYFVTRWLWERQQLHAAFEKYYLDLLSNLTKLRIALQDQLDELEGPQPQYAEPRNPEYFGSLQQAAGAAREAIQQLKGAARVFLTDGAVAALHALEVAFHDAVHDGGSHYDYAAKGLEAADHAYNVVLAEARKAIRPKS